MSLYQVRGPCTPQERGNIIFSSDKLSEAYGMMIECRRLIGRKIYHVYDTKGSESVKLKQFVGISPENYSGKLKIVDKDLVEFAGTGTGTVTVTEIQNEGSDEIILYRPSNAVNRNFRSLIGSEIVLEGLIGIGKSTLGRSLYEYLKKAGFNVKFFPEFVNEDLLGLYISDMKKYAFSYQCIIARERLRVYDEAKHFSSQGGISIIDRSLVGDVAFATMLREQGLIDDREWDVYKKFISVEYPEPIITLYLEGGPSLAFERMKRRNLQSEVSGYTLGYFERLEKAYQKAFDNSKNVGNVVRIPWDNDVIVNENVLDPDACENVLLKVRDSLNR